MKKALGRPLKGEAKRVRTSLTLPPLQLEWLTQREKELKQSRSELVQQLLHEAMYHQPQRQELSRLRFPVSTDTIAHFCRQHHIKQFAVFGSILRDDFTPQSDIDILVTFEAASIPSFFELVRMENELSRIFGRKVDLKTVAELSRYFREDVMKEAEVLYAA